ncbi:Sugar fermentation stimulation protein homolog [Tepidanaerobacter acetatoxydans Re1]|uniref:Sugar fermentation stimulation protein homolog n=1 Tax=Tepidanaerobacter acetatoxydans (strain DSM 21804 / JCM 16047 / Re1) TaxID=1209989 RepID=F4LU28_TEPAE|nr:DNA/RNA nuclease SfsA [Tepidanaerobacter acetatoxydans]AEE90554.1 Sugar fermentation stimulation protein A [Tepidanaerobacter acetatoxydans Re1]CCP25069.1 Sugar fermentation stimulation protein homolog [Tepidanaerobacter acetatoxydans Re1]
MFYKNIKQAKFINRPNRFIANIEIEGRNEVCHVKNTGRCKELLIPNATVFVQEHDNNTRKTKYDLISVYKGDRLINIDSQAPNKIFHQWMMDSDLFKDISFIKPETRYKNSRFDFYVETANAKTFVEVKGVTLEKNGVALFPDAPTERGVKHINELIDSISDGYDAWIAFIIQMKDVTYFTPNINTHKAFGDALIDAKRHSVNIVALDCDVTKNSIKARDFVEVRL